MADISSTVAGLMPRFGGSSSVFTFITWLVIAGIFLGGVGLVAYLFVRWMKFNNKIIIFEKIAGQFERTKTDKAMEVKVSKAGDTVFYFRRYKKYVPTPSFQAGRREFWFFKREDGELINIKPGDYDAEARALGAKYLDKEVRYQRSQIQKALKDRYDKDSFWKTHGATVLTFSFIALIAVMSWFLFDKWIEGLNAVPNILDKLASLLDRMDTIMGSMDNICTGGSGMIPAS